MPPTGRAPDSEPPPRVAPSHPSLEDLSPGYALGKTYDGPNELRNWAQAQHGDALQRSCHLPRHGDVCFSCAPNWNS